MEVVVQQKEQLSFCCCGKRQGIHRRRVFFLPFCKGVYYKIDLFDVNKVRFMLLSPASKGTQSWLSFTQSLGHSSFLFKDEKLSIAKHCGTYKSAGTTASWHACPETQYA